MFERIYSGQANFLLAKLADQLDGSHLQRLLEPSRILIRVCDNFEGMDNRYVRFAVKDTLSISLLADSLKMLSQNIGSR